MEKVNAKLLNWASILEQGTRDQAVTTASMPFIHPHVALMPDAHLGLLALGMTMGQWLCVPMVLGGIALWHRAGRRQG